MLAPSPFEPFAPDVHALKEPVEDIKGKHGIFALAALMTGTRETTRSYSSIMRVRPIVRIMLRRNDMQISEAHAALRHHAVSEGFDLFDRALQH